MSLDVNEWEQLTPLDMVVVREVFDAVAFTCQGCASQVACVIILVNGTGGKHENLW